METDNSFPAPASQSNLPLIDLANSATIVSDDGAGNIIVAASDKFCKIIFQTGGKISFQVNGAEVFSIRSDGLYDKNGVRFITFQPEAISGIGLSGNYATDYPQIQSFFENLLQALYNAGIINVI